MPINGLTKVHRPLQKTIEIKKASDEPDSQQNEPSKTVTSPSAEYNSTSKEKKEVEKWCTGEKILCFHGPLIYEAKIQMVEIQNGMPKYFIHYHGWNKNWDEWVPEARMLKFTEKNTTIQKDLVRAHEEKINEKRRRSLKRRADEEPELETPKSYSVRPEHVFVVPKAPSPVPRARRKAGLRPQRRVVTKNYSIGEEDEDEAESEDKRKKSKVESLKPPDNTVESKELYNSKVEIRIKIPDELKSFIVDDWEQITRNKATCVLPAKLTVDQLLDNYKRARTSNKTETASKNNREDAISEVITGIREYFNVMLPTQLLFKSEKLQFQQLKQSDASMIPMKTYGAPHLLRLFTKLGAALAYTPLAEKSIAILLFYVNDILNYIKKNSSLIFSNSDYMAAEDQETSDLMAP